MKTGQNIAILIPCYNEALTIGQVVNDFRHHLPHAKIYVYDNNSTDQTIEQAQHAGAEVRLEQQQGKGNVVRRMFADIEADLYILVDGDATYEAEAALEGIKKLNSGPYDLVNIKRIHTQNEAYRFGHIFGNKLLTGLVKLFFKSNSDDMLSGYKIWG